jgi:hypothetical protein
MEARGATRLPSASTVTVRSCEGGACILAVADGTAPPQFPITAPAPGSKASVASTTVTWQPAGAPLGSNATAQRAQLPAALAAVEAGVTVVPQAGAIYSIAFLEATIVFTLPQTRSVGVCGRAATRHAVAKFPGVSRAISAAACPERALDHCCQIPGAAALPCVFGTETDGVIVCRLIVTRGELAVVPVVAVPIPTFLRYFPVTRITAARSGSAVDLCVTASSFASDRVLHVEPGRPNAASAARVVYTSVLAPQVGTVRRDLLCTVSGDNVLTVMDTGEQGRVRFKAAASKSFLEEGAGTAAAAEGAGIARLVVLPVETADLPLGIELAVRAAGVAGFRDAYFAVLLDAQGRVSLWHTWNAERGSPELVGVQDAPRPPTATQPAASAPSEAGSPPRTRRRKEAAAKADDAPLPRMHLDFAASLHVRGAGVNHSPRVPPTDSSAAKPQPLARVHVHAAVLWPEHVDLFRWTLDIPPWTDSADAQPDTGDEGAEVLSPA